MTPENDQKRLKILFVDDNPSMTKLFAILGDEYQFDAFTANSLKEAVELTRRVLPDVVLTDVRMPEGGGYQLIGELLAIEETKHIPVVGCSVTYHDVEKEWKFFGGTKFVNDKPSTLETLNQILDGVVTKLIDKSKEI